MTTIEALIEALRLDLNSAGPSLMCVVFRENLHDIICQYDRLTTELEAVKKESTEQRMRILDLQAAHSNASCTLQEVLLKVEAMNDDYSPLIIRKL